MGEKKPEIEFLLADEGGWWVHINRQRWGTYDGVCVADGHRLLTPGKSERGWWFLPGDIPLLIEFFKPPVCRTIQYALRRENFAPTDTYPATMSGEEYDERASDGERILWDMYEASVQVWHLPELPMSIPVGGVPILEGAPPAYEPNHQWTARLPQALHHQPHYAHLFPGHIEGFWPALREHLEKMPIVESAYDHSGFSVYTRANYEGQPASRQDRDSSLQRMEFTPPKTISGDTYEEARARWHELLGQYAEEVEASRPAVCPTCGAVRKEAA